MRLKRHVITSCAVLLLVAAPLLAAPPLPALELTIIKLLGTTRQEEIMLNRIVPYAGAHIGGVHVDTSRTPARLYLFDSANNRILGFRKWSPATLPDGPFAHADIVIGQPAIWDAGAANGDSTRFLPPRADTLALLPFPFVSSTAEAPRSNMMATDPAGNFYLVDLCNNRVLKFIDPFETDQIADDVWGQPSFTNRSPTNGSAPPPTSATTLRTQWNYGTTIGAFSAGVDVDSAGNLWVADSFNNRVLRFTGGSKTADLVLGQANFTSSIAGTAPNRMYHPTGVRVRPASGEVFVLDGQDDLPPGPRIMVFRPPFSNGMNAHRVFGTNYLSWSRGFCLDPFDTNIIWVADGGKDRIVQFNHLTGQPLDVIGQLNLTSYLGIGKYVRPSGEVADFKQPDGSISIDRETNLYFTSFYGLNKVIRIPLPITRNAQGHVWSNGEMMKEGMNENTGRTFQDHYGMARWGTQLYVRDRLRVLVWTNYYTAVTFQSADFVIGQSGLDKNEPGGTFEARWPTTLHCASNFLFVCTDWKLFIFETPITNGGRNYPPLKTIDGGPSTPLRWADDNSPCYPVLFSSVAYDPVSNVLWVAQNYSAGNPGARVLRIRNPFALNPIVDMVLGQTNKTGGLKNKGKYIEPYGPFTVDGTDMANPSLVFLDNYRNVYVVDSGYEGRVDNGGNRRVVRFDASKADSAPGLFPNYAADAVFCKPDLTTTRDHSELNRPGTPITVSFGPNNEMILTDDTYDGATVQGMRIFYYPTPHVGAAPQPTHIIGTYVGQPAFVLIEPGLIILQDHTWNRILFHAPRATAPFIDITNAVVTVRSPAGTLGGTNVNVVGTLWWSNERGGNGTVPASAAWTIPAIPLAFGPNLITVSGTNTAGVVASDTVTITRDYANGEGPPEVSITNAPLSLPSGITNWSLGGTANRHVVGALRWQNQRGGSGSVPATSSWVITGIPLAGGANLISVTGTNLFGSNAVATITITRAPAPGEGTPVVVITTPDTTVDEPVSSYDIYGTNNEHVVGGMWWVNSLGGSGTMPAGLSWSALGVPLALGENIISVYGTNVYGDTASAALRITREAVITATHWQVLSVTNGRDYSGVGAGLRMNQRSTLVKNYDQDGYIYLQGHASSGNPRTQSIWRVRASIAPEASAAAWQLCVGGIPCNDAGGEEGQTWLKFSNIFYSSMWCQFGIPNGGPWYWSWYGFYSTNVAGVPAVPGAVPHAPLIVRATGDAYPDAARNLGGILAWMGISAFTAVCTDRHDPSSAAGQDAQIRRWNGFNVLTTLAERECEGVNTMFAVCGFDRGRNGRAFFLDCRSPSGLNYIWCATNLFAGPSQLLQAFRLAPIPGSNTSDAVVDLVVMNSERFYGNTLLAVSVWTDGGRKILLYNADRPDLAPTNITPSLGSHQWRNTLAAYGPYLFMSYDLGGEQPGLLRLSLYNVALTGLGVPEPDMWSGVLLASGIIFAWPEMKRRRSSHIHAFTASAGRHHTQSAVMHSAR
ncbi:MAG: hypothetical protein N2595_00280 [bacterium]|nr:hypothetical protein [bacterium]